MTTTTTTYGTIENLTDGTWIVAQERGTAADYGMVIGDEVAWECGGNRTRLADEIGTCTIVEDEEAAEALWAEHRADG